MKLLAFLDEVTTKSKVSGNLICLNLKQNSPTMDKEIISLQGGIFETLSKYEKTGGVFMPSKWGC